MGTKVQSCKVFGLFRCGALSDLGAVALNSPGKSTGAPRCSEERRLRGGYGTVGESVVTAIPLSSIGVRPGGKIDEVEVFTAIGSYGLGALQILDTARP